MKTKVSPKLVRTVAFTAMAAFVVCQVSIRVDAQKPDKARSNETTSSAKPSAPKSTAPANNVEYGAKVKANTTESYFMTELVDHLPASDKVPSPDIFKRFVSLLQRTGEGLAARARLHRAGEKRRREGAIPDRCWR